MTAPGSSPHNPRVEPGLWPHLETGGELEPAEVEWLHTNGAGAYAMSTVALMHTRREHGLLVAPTGARPGAEYSVILSHAETSVQLRGRSFRLATHRFPGTAPTPGYRRLREFSQDPIPRWTYELSAGRFERTACLARGENALVLGYTWHGEGVATATIRPLMAMRPYKELMREHGGVLQRVVLKPGLVQIEPTQHLDPIHFGHTGIFVGSPEWWRKFEYSRDGAHGGAAEEDLWTPGVFEMSLDPEVTKYLVVTLGEPSPLPPEALVAEVREQLLLADPGPTRPPSVRRLCVAGEQFCAELATSPTILSGYPPPGHFVRDAVMAVPGLFLTRGRVRPATDVLGATIKTMEDGWLPEHFATSMDESRFLPAQERACVDATLWLFETVRALSDWTGADDAFMREVAYPALSSALGAVLDSPRSSGIWLDERGFVCVTRSARASSWMDAAFDGEPVTPRHGAAVEHQALLARGARFLASLAEEYGDSQLSRRAGELEKRIRSAFSREFWCDATDYPYDTLPSTPGEAEGADGAIRPNAVLALSVAPELFSAWQAKSVLNIAKARLLTPRGLRSLDPKSPSYRGEFGASLEAQSYTFHQGAAWTFLLAAYARAAIHVDPEDFEVQADLRHLVEEVLEGGPVLGQVSQLCDAEPPFRPQGIPAQATSVSALLWVLAAELGL